MYYIGIDFGGMSAKIGVVDKSGNILAKASSPTGADRSVSEIVKTVAELCFEQVQIAKLTMDEIEYIGIAMPGTIDIENALVHYSPNLQQFNNVSWKDELQKFVDKPIYIGNDANVAALGEAFAGATKNCQHSIMITLGTGVGGGIIIDRKIYGGYKYRGAELGHMVIKTDGALCGCGKRGCFEAYASAGALKRMTYKAVLLNKDSLIRDLVDNRLEMISGKTAFDASRAGDETGKKIVESYIKYLAEGLTNIITIFSPEVIAIGGGVSNEGDNLLLPLRAEMEKIAYGRSCKDPTRVVIAELGNDAGIIGAAMLGQEFIENV